MLFRNKRILIVGAHPDDHEFGCGGVINMIDRELLTLVLVCDSGDIRNREFSESMKILDVKNIIKWNIPERVVEYHKQELRQLLYDLPPFDYIFTHADNDYHQDHKAISECCLSVFHGDSLFFYSSEYLSNLFIPNLFVAIDEDCLSKKIKSLQCYNSQKHRNYISEDIIRSKVMISGAKSNTKYAEDFRIYRMTI